VRWDFGYCGHYWPIVPAPDNRWWWLWKNWWNKDWQGKLKYLEKTCPSATLSTTNPTWLNPGSNLGRRSGKPATNRLSYGTAKLMKESQPSKNYSHPTILKIHDFIFWIICQVECSVTFSELMTLKMALKHLPKR
jgi:hypothetical protein